MNLSLGFGLNKHRVQQGAVLKPPAYSLVTLWLDGTIVDVAGSKYFVDKKAGNNILITGYDFPVNWTKGFPYKSSATIDVFGQTAVPVVSLFQNFDYENQYFTKHIGQTYDSSGVEIKDAHIIDIVSYSEALTGDNLTSANNYFDVPTKATTNVKWVSLIGNNANPGTEESTWPTLLKANASATTGDTIYVKSGSYIEDHLGTDSGHMLINKNLSYKIIGKVNISAKSAAPRVVFQSSIFFSSFERAIIASSVRMEGLTSQGTHAGNLAVYKNLMLSGLTNPINLYSDKEVLLENIITNDCNNRINLIGLITNIINCYLKNSVGVYDLTSLNDAVINILRSKIDANISLSGVHTTANVIGSNFLGISGVAGHIDGSVYVKYCTIAASLSFILGGYTKLEILNNLMTSTATATIFSSKSPDVKINNNIAVNITTNNYFKISVDAASGFTSCEIKNNRLNHKNNTEPCIIIGNEASANYNSVSGIISGNKVSGLRDFSPLTVHSAHMVPVFNNSQIDVKYNFISGGGIGIAYKNINLDSLGKSISYNIIKNCSNGIGTKGIKNVFIHNNLIIDCFGRSIESLLNGAGIPVTGCVYKNNITIITGNSTSAFYLQNSVDTQIDYNIYYSTSALIFFIDGVQKTWAEWQAAGHDANSIVLTETQFNGLFTDFLNGDYTLKAGSLAIGAGVDLGEAYNDKLSSSSNWGSDTQKPLIVTENQSTKWNIGPY